MSNVPRTQGDESANLRKAVDGLLHTIATQVPRDAPFSFMLTRDVAEVSRALVTLSAARAEALEEAAGVCEELAALARKSGAGAGMIEGYVSAAAMLRALAQKAGG